MCNFLRNFSISDNAYYQKVSQSRKAVKFMYRIILSLWNRLFGRTMMIETINLALGTQRDLSIMHLIGYRNRYIDFLIELYICDMCPYPEPVYTGWSSVHWNGTGMPLVDSVYTGTPLEKLSWNSPTLECHWRNLVESAPHWDATGETLTFTAYTGTPLEGLWQPTHAPTHIV